MIGLARWQRLEREAEEKRLAEERRKAEEAEKKRLEEERIAKEKVRLPVAHVG